MKSTVLALAMILGLAFASAHATVTFDNVDASLGNVSPDALSPFDGLTLTSHCFVYTSQPGFHENNNEILSGPDGACGSGEQSSDTGFAPIIGESQFTRRFDFANAYLGSGNYDNPSFIIHSIHGEVRHLPGYDSKTPTGSEHEGGQFRG